MATSTVFSSGTSSVLRAQAADDFRLLSTAASKAEEAASRYENNTAGLFHAKNSTLRKDITETSYLSANYHFPLKAPPTVMNSPVSIQGTGRDGNTQDSFKANDRGSRSLPPQKSNSSAPKRSLNSLASIETLQDDILAPSLKVKMPRNTDSLCNLETQKNSTHVPFTRISRSQSLLSETSSSDPLGQTTKIKTKGASSRKSIERLPVIDKLMDQRRQHTPPKRIIEWMNGQPPLASEPNIAQSRSEISEPINAEEAPKTRSSLPQTSPAYQSSKGALNTPRQMSDIRPIQSPISDAVKTTIQPMKNSSVQNPGQSTTTNLNTMPVHLAEDLAFVQVFNDTICNSIIASAKVYRGRLPENVLRSIGISVSDYTIIRLAKMLRNTHIEIGCEPSSHSKVSKSCQGMLSQTGRRAKEQDSESDRIFI